MRIREYLEKKYQIRVPTTITAQEARAFGIQYPLRPDWLHKEGGRLISTDMAKQAAYLLRNRIERRGMGSKKAVLTNRGLDILDAYIAGAYTPPEYKSKVIRREKKPAPVVHSNASDAFLQTYEWRRVRMEALKKYGARCQCCGASPETGAVMNVDHIKPRRLFPQLALELSNLQVLCGECNHGKGNWDMTDWRGMEAEARHMKDISK